MIQNLNLLIIFSILSAVGIMAVEKKMVRWIAFTGAAFQFIIVIGILFAYLGERALGNTAQFLFEQKSVWFDAFHIEYHIGIDGISLAMLMLTSVVVMTGILLSWKTEYMTKEFFFLLTSLSAGAYGFFISLDLFTMFFFLELAVIPKYLLISIWGSGKKEYSAMKLALMLMGGSALILIGLIGVYFQSMGPDGQHTFDLIKLAKMHIPMEAQRYLFPLIFTGFGVFTALFPFHTWVPDGHSSAPTAGSMFLAGISMKLGGYGCIRVATYLMPEAALEYSWIIISLATIAIIYGSFVTMMQKDLKYINAYSSISHCGFVLMGIGMMTKTAMAGAVMQMVSHGLMTALFFGAIGMLYERTHTKDIDKLGGLLKSMPFLSSVYIIAGLCSLGLPGFSGFVAEMTILVGSWQRTGLFERITSVIACISIVVTAVYILRAIAKAVLGPYTNEEHATLKDARWNEKTASVVLICSILAIGVLPFWLYNLITPDTKLIIEKIAHTF